MDTVAHGSMGRGDRPNTARLFERIMNDKPHPEMVIALSRSSA